MRSEKKFNYLRASLFLEIILITFSLFLLASCSASGEKKLIANQKNEEVKSSLQLELVNQIIELPTPKGVGKDLFERLKEELIKEIYQQAGSNSVKSTQVAPTGILNQVNDLEIIAYDDESIQLKWTYKNQGDGTEDGVVNLSDLIPIAENFLKTSNNPLARVADYNLDGVVDISDVKTLAQNFRASVSAYLVYVSNPLDGENYELVRVSFDERTPSIGNDYFIVDVPNSSFRSGTLPSEGTGIFVTPIDVEGNSGEPSHPVYIGAPRILAISPTSGRESEEVTFSAEVVGGESLTYSWGFPSTWEPTESSEAHPTVLLSTPRDYNIALTVTNPFGSHSVLIRFRIQPSGAPLILGISPTQTYDQTSVTFSAILSGDPPFEYEWQFPENFLVDNPNLANPTVTTPEPGNYSVQLTVSNELGVDTFKTQVKVVFGERPRILSISPSPANLPMFEEARFSVEAEGVEPLTYNWNFGGAATPNTSTEKFPRVEPTFPGFYSAYVEVRNPLGTARKNFAINVGYRPQIIDISPTSGVKDSIVTFSARTTGSLPIYYIWNFSGWAEPEASIEESPEVTLTALADVYAGWLLIGNIFDTDILAFTFQITEKVLLPPSILNVTPKSGRAGEELSLTASVTGDPPYDFTWDFGGGTEPLIVSGNSDTVTASIRLLYPGRYNSLLTVSNSVGTANYNFTLTILYNEIENNDLPSQANALPTLPVVDFWGNLGPGGYDGDENDYFFVDLLVGQRLTATIEYNSDTDFGFRLLDSGGVVKADGIIVGDGLQELQWDVDADGRYYIRCFYRSGPTTDYSMDVSSELIN